jgi:flagellar motor component MotA
MVRRLGYKGTVAIMKDSRLTPAFSVMGVVIVLVAAAFAVATTFPVTTIFP